MTRSNCLIWAVRKLIAEGGYLCMRRTRRGRCRWLAWWPHVLWSPDLVRWYSFVPRDAVDVVSPPLLFYGKVVEGDAVENEPGKTPVFHR